MYRLVKQTPAVIGKHAFVIKGGRNQKVLDRIREKYGRPNAILKVFNASPLRKKKLWDVKWGDDPKRGNPRLNTKLIEATQIQNICHWHGLAPRVYALFEVELSEVGRVACQLTEDAGEDHATSHDEAYVVYEKVKGLGATYHFKNEKDDVQAHDSVGGLLVDFQTFAFDIPYATTVEEIYTRDGKYGKKYYQDQKVLGLTGGPRKSDDRIAYLGLDKIDFKGKSVLDLGCAGGFFCNYAEEMGAKMIVGLDCRGKGSPDPLNAARHLSNFLGNWNIDYLEWDLENRLVKVFAWPVTSFDVVLFLSMAFHIGIPDPLAGLGKLTIFEDNSKNRDAEPALKRMFKKVEKVGISKDHGDKPVYHCWR